jgi:two-component system chemotaxis response regulator CheY
MEEKTKARVLIVDDDRFQRQFLTAILRQSGLILEESWEAGNGEQALAIFDTQNVNLIFSDLYMPSMDGMSFIREIRSREKGKDIPIVMISSEQHSHRVIEARRSGANNYLVKPLKPRQVKLKLAEILPSAFFRSVMTAI